MVKRWSFRDRVLSALLRLISADTVEQPTETLDLPFSYLDSWFDRDLGQAENFLHRFRDHLDVNGKVVLEAGSGLGPLCFLAAQRVAREVVGIDIVPKWLEYAEDKLRRDYPELTDRIRFVHTSGDLSEVADHRFDVIISHNAFEHYPDPEAMANHFRSMLAEGGRLFIAFGPLWKSPYGGHVWYITRLPWAHLIFPEHVMMAEKRRLLPKEDAGGYEDAIGGLNRMTVDRFNKVMRRSGLRCVYYQRNVSDHSAMRVMRLLSSARPLREYFTHNLYSVWTRA
jgi:SAM-dependent methyltransferase